MKEPIYVAYHDNEWGVPEYDPRALYEKLVLDGFQAGLVLDHDPRKRENFRAAFDDFDPQKIARYGKRDVNRLMKNDGIVRSPAKIEAAITGAQLWLDIEEKEPGGFTEFIWKHVDGKPKQNRFRTLKQVPAKTTMSEGLSKELKTARLQFRRAGDRLCLRAGRRHGQRPHDRLLPPSRNARCWRDERRST